MALTAKQAIQHIEHALAGRPEIDPIDIVNGAGKLLYQMRNWSFRQRGPATLNFVASQSYIELPANFGTFTYIQMTDALTRRVRQVTLPELQEYRLILPSPDSARDFWVAVAFEVPTAPATRIAPRLEIHPTPSSNETGALTYLYKARWVDVSDDDADLPGVPEMAELLYLRACRQLAKSYEDEDTEGYTDLLGSLRMSEEYRGAVKDDVNVHNSYGTLRNGIGSMDWMDRRGTSFWDRPVNAPS